MESSQLPNKHLKCWVPVCSTVKTSDKIVLLPLPNNAKTRELWLALAGRPKSTSSFEDIVLCEEHFSESDIAEYDNLKCINSLPLLKMPEKICRTCMKIIPTNDNFYVISNVTTTDMPTSLQETMLYYTSNTSLTLGYILSKTIPEMDIKFDPPPLMCNSCYRNIWLYYTFAITCIEIESTLKENISLENYSKMVLCRSCPRMQGTYFIGVDENTSMGCILKNIFGQNDQVKESLPLRLCLSCHDILKELDTFRNCCLLVEEKLKRHYALEQEIAERRKSLCLKLKISSSNNQGSSYSAEQPEILSFGCDSKENSPQKLLNENPIMLQQWKKELFVKTLLECNSKLKNRSNDKVYISAQKKLQKAGINCNLYDINLAWKELLNTAKMKSKNKQPLEILDQLVLEYNKNSTKYKNNATASTSGTEQCNLKKKTKSIRITFSVPEKMSFVEEIKKEYNVLVSKKDKILHMVSPWGHIIKKIANRGFLNYDFERLFGLWNRLKLSARIHEKDGRDIVDVEIWNLLELHKTNKQNKINSHIKNIKEEDDNCKSDIKQASPKAQSDISTENNISVNADNKSQSIIEIQAPIEFQIKNEQDTSTKTERHSWTEEDKLKVFKLIKNEYNTLTKNNTTSKRISWAMVIKSIIDKNSHYREQDLVYIWSSLKSKVMIHEKTGQMSDLDWKVWRLLRRSKGLSVSDPNPLPTDKKTIVKTVLKPKRLSEQEKLAVIAAVKEYGNSIFQKYEAPNENPVWNKIFEKLKQQGYNIPNIKIKGCWRAMNKSATMAMADQKSVSKFDKIIIDFMKQIASTKSDDNDTIIKTSSHSNENSSDSDNYQLNYDHVSKQDAVSEANKIKAFEKSQVKTEIPESCFKLEDGVDEVINLCDDDPDDIFQETQIKSE